MSDTDNSKSANDGAFAFGLQGSTNRSHRWTGVLVIRTIAGTQNKNGVVISHNAVRKNNLLPEFFGVADGARTHDNRNHNPGLYQLSYSHH